MEFVSCGIIYMVYLRQYDIFYPPCPCGKARESRIYIVAECELYQEERGILEEEMREVNEGGMKSFDILYSREKTIAILGDRWRPQTAKQDGDKICNVWKKRNERLNVEGVSIRSRNGAPSRERRVVNGNTTKASNN